MNGETQIVTKEQLDRLKAARDDANRRMSQAMRTKDRALTKLAQDDATNWNKAYDAANKQFKKQQKRQRRDEWRTTMIKFYLDYQEAGEQA